MRYSRGGALRMDLTCICWPAMAVPTIVKMPEPMTAPMPREVRLSQPSDFLSLISAPSQSEMSWSMSLQRNSGEATQVLRRCGMDARPLYLENRLRARNEIRARPKREGQDRLKR